MLSGCASVCACVRRLRAFVPSRMHSILRLACRRLLVYYYSVRDRGARSIVTPHQLEFTNSSTIIIIIIIIIMRTAATTVLIVPSILR